MKRQGKGRAAYENLTKLFNRLSVLGGVQQRLYRDMQTVMAKGSAEEHDHQTAVLSEIAHAQFTDPKVGKWLEAAEADAGILSSEEKTNLRLMRREHVHEASLSADLVKELKKAENEGERLHTAEKDGGDWNRVLPSFEKMLGLQRQQAAIKQKALGLKTPYDALLDVYSPGMTTADYDRLFDELEPFLKKLLPQVKAKQATEEPPAPLQGPFAPDKTEKLCREMIAKIGFDSNRGVVYFSDGHPESTGTPDDTRISGGADPGNFMAPLYDMMHETGHGIYDQNTPKSWRHQPAGHAMGMDVHESQSLVWEFVVGKSPEFAQHLSERAQEIFDRKDDPALSAGNLLKLNTRVNDSLVRISLETSEVTYLLHIIMRYRLEKDMINGKLEPKDLPKAWDDMAEEMFGKKPKDNAEGCMQDVHWFCGLYGYFPSYALGYMGAVQLFGAAVKAHPEIPGEIEKGNFRPLQQFLTDNVHSKGSLLSAKELMRQATGAALGAAALKKHLADRYLGQSASAPWIKNMPKI